MLGRMRLPALGLALVSAAAACSADGSGNNPMVRSQTGDLELVVRVILPSGHDPRARALYEKMAVELSDFDTPQTGDTLRVVVPV